jgi:hypothetical protein
MLPIGPRVRALVLVALLAGASAALLGGPVNGFSGGISEELEAQGGGTTTLVEGGCSCHNTAYTGEAIAVLEGVPAFYVYNGELRPGPYNLTIRIIGGPAPAGNNRGGFNLQVDQGELQVPPGATDVKIEDGEATHTTAGNDQRNWTVLWLPPTAAGPDAQFILTVNAVNGNGAPDPGDAWGRATAIAMGATRLGAAPAGEGPVEEIVHLGVNFYAYWVGVISFIVLFVVLAATFFLLRYGESKHWTDWKDRPARDKGEAPPAKAYGLWAALAMSLLLLAIAAANVLRMV